MLPDWCMDSWGSSGVSGAKLYFWFAAAGDWGTICMQFEMPKGQAL
jgi:hypothetical protein